ncbi:hypothetical protein [Paraburkholderia sp.]|uniref:hypothetical protein n=1 Tax=Paraburkholderia sp. TaxID=1926495 RepID=UPI0023A74F2A|nr:hypothetical protein [Paraburkholderia sp.]MDE1183510.1 hypothetical protein [Paraburkholderia sp.]
MIRLICIALLAAGLGGCVVAPGPYGYGYGPAYYAPGYYAAPSVSVGVGFGGGYGGYGGYGHGWRR